MSENLSKLPLSGSQNRGKTMAAGLLMAHALLIASVSPQWGADNPLFVGIQIGLSALAFFFILRANGAQSPGPGPLSFQTPMGMVLAFAGILFTLFGDTMYGGEGETLIPYRFLLFPFMCVYFLGHTPPEKSLLRPLYARRRWIFWLLVAGALFFRLAIVPVSPSPLVDVYWFTNQGAAGLLEGINPYDRAFHVVDPKSEFLYAYLPAQFLFDLPANLLFGDMRWGQILLELAAAGLIYKTVMGRAKDDFRRHSAELITLLFLFYPPFMKAHEHAWVEFKQLFAIALFAFIASRDAPRSRIFAPIGLLFSLKQTAWAAGPFMLKHRDFNLRSVGVIAGIMALFILPFLLWNPQAFIDDIILYHVGLPLPKSPSVAWFITLLTGNTPGLLSVAIPGALTFIYCWRSGSNSTVGVLISATALGFLPVLMRQAYVNYYHYVDGMLLTALALCLRAMHDQADSKKAAKTPSSKGILPLDIA